MPTIIDLDERHVPGTDILMGSEAEDGTVAVVFEDDGRTGYFYACERMNGPILDAMQIYSVANVVDREQPSTYKIGWAPEGRRAVLMINGHPHAVFDFEARRGWCRTGFPPSRGRWSAEGHEWDEACLAPFR
jgi:hypothetical protein